MLSGGQEATAASQGSASVAVGDISGSTAAFDAKEDLFADAQPGTEAASHSELFGNAQLDLRLLLLADSQAGSNNASPVCLAVRLHCAACMWLQSGPCNVVFDICPVLACR